MSAPARRSLRLRAFPMFGEVLMTSTVDLDIEAELRLWSAKQRQAELASNPIALQIARRRLDWLLDRWLDQQ